jgi:hypothetical protein
MGHFISLICPAMTDAVAILRDNMAVRALYLPDEINPRESMSTGGRMLTALQTAYCFPEGIIQLEPAGHFSPDSGFFRFGHDATCYGRTTAGRRASKPGMQLDVLLPQVRSSESSAFLPVDPTEIIDNLRLERYASHLSRRGLSSATRILRELYYVVRPWMGLDIRKRIQRAHIYGWEKIAFPSWPVDTTVERIGERVILSAMRAAKVDRVPFVWFWPEGARSAVITTHDVEARLGRDFCGELMTIDDSFGIKASFQIVPEGSYGVTDSFLYSLRDRGFEINVQDLNHDGRLFNDLKEFRRRAAKINQYGRDYDAKGFRSAVLYRNQDWYDELQFSYDMSVPSVAHLDPQRGGCCTVMPYFIGNILELPLTTTQDYMLFHLLGDYSLELWKAQVKLILERNGLISFLSHPDYLKEKRARSVYIDLLRFLSDLGTTESLWFALPGEVDQWWRSRSQMRVVKHGSHWRITGPEAERAVLAFAKASGDHLEYEIDSKVARLNREGA